MSVGLIIAGILVGTFAMLFGFIMRKVGRAENPFTKGMIYMLVSFIAGFILLIYLISSLP